MSSRYLDVVLGPEQRQVWERLAMFGGDFYLAGGTALALQIGHRISYDFDFFTQENIDGWREKVVLEFGGGVRFSMDTTEQLSWFTNEGVKITLALSKQRLLHELEEVDGLRLASVEEISCDKAFVLGRRGAYRDYVDLYFCLKQGQKLKQIVADAGQKYGALFEEKMFLEQLVYMDDLPEAVVELVGEKLGPDEIKEYLKAEVKMYVEERKKGE